MLQPLDVLLSSVAVFVVQRSVCVLHLWPSHVAKHAQPHLVSLQC